jgi:multisubunit Na+/H+ antiporter MnhC subunit
MDLTHTADRLFAFPAMGASTGQRAVGPIAAGLVLIALVIGLVIARCGPPTL